MRLTLLKENGIWRASEVHRVHLDLMRMASDEAGLGDFPEGRKRMYPSPMAAREAYQEEEFIGDWKEYVSSDLEIRFAGDVGTFLSDLDDATVTGLTEDGEKIFSLSVPIEHGQAWFSTLNQARLMLDLKHKLHPEESEVEESVVREMPGIDNSEARLFVIAQYELYSWIQEWLVQHVL